MDKSNKKIFNINTRSPEDTIPVTKKYLFDADILSILFDAKPATQIPFLRNAMRKYNKIQSSEEFAQLECGLLKALFRDFKNIEVRFIEDWINNALNMGVESEFLLKLSDMLSSYYGKLQITDVSTDQTEVVFDNFQLTPYGENKFIKLREKWRVLIITYQN